MTDVFLYGTLCHAPLRAVVLGEDRETTPARLQDHAVVSVVGESFPMIVKRPGAVAQGVLIADLATDALARLDYYECGLGYQPATECVLTDDGPVQARWYLLPDTGFTPGEPWDTDAWAKRWGPLACLTAEEILADKDKRPAADVARRRGPLRARAQARLNARKSAPTTLRRRAGPGDVQLARRNLVYSQFFSVEEYDITHRKFSGEQGEALNRTAFISADAVTVLPYDPERDRVLLIEQFRAGPYARGDSQPWMLEPIAGRIDGGEAPEESARREALEEAGLALKDLHLVAQYYPTPGAKSEYLFGYIATADLPDDVAGVAGLESEGEDIRSHVIAFDRAMELVESGEINVGPLILLLLHLARLREGLRSGS
ncbi:NUDIX domain-containing protein [Tropicimonas isoalkanivorans]|uniref:ADP-ribose pyrophosphatase n=1 Tax=Tropicimonas isoalkanivorans TaxID=441112 RepID=A0A1I1DQE5_9RHOB|nr:NUDIX domain-containing protein [Tropicimonas isoalkanivorans]SFB74793.1 nudix-type nucleoside diphosphatase, YffH/AdpP family [Tropicimonas isoalkanivorans]